MFLLLSADEKRHKRLPYDDQNNDMDGKRDCSSHNHFRGALHFVSLESDKY